MSGLKAHVFSATHTRVSHQSPIGSGVGVPVGYILLKCGDTNNVLMHKGTSYSSVYFKNADDPKISTKLVTCKKDTEQTYLHPGLSAYTVMSEDESAVDDKTELSTLASLLGLGGNAAIATTSTSMATSMAGTEGGADGGGVIVSGPSGGDTSSGGSVKDTMSGVLSDVEAFPTSTLSPTKVAGLPLKAVEQGSEESAPAGGAATATAEKTTDGVADKSKAEGGQQPLEGKSGGPSRTPDMRSMSLVVGIVAVLIALDWA